MKRFLGACVVALCMLLFIPGAHAEEVNVDITATPTELTEGGTVEFSFEIANYNADYPLQDLTITYLDTAYDVMHGAEIPPSGSVRDIVLSLEVSDSQLGSPIVFTIAWTRNGEPMSEEASITIARAENPVISVTRTVDKENAKPGEEVVLKYTIQNDTKFDMSDIMLIDENISDDPILQHDTLRASSSYSIDYRYTMGDESVVSSPVVTYSVNGKTKTYTSIEPLTLTMVLIQLDMDVEMGTPTPSGVNFTIVVTNTGSQTISGISISDERANLVNEETFSLEPGESNTLSFLVVPLMTEPLRNVKFKLTGTDPFSETYTLETENSYEVYPFVDESQISVTVTAETVTQWTSETGSVTARIVITNHSTVELTNITISETSIGVIKNYEVLSAGETTFDQEIELGSPRNLSFTVKGYDPTGTNRTLASCLMPVAYGTETATAEPTATPVQNTGSLTLFNNLSAGISKVLIVLGALMVLSFIVLIVLTAIEHAKTPYRFDDDEEDDLDDFDDYFAEPENPAPKRDAYRGEPNQEEISYTKRMLAAKDEGQAGTVNNGAAPISLPPAPKPDTQRVRRDEEPETAAPTARRTAESAGSHSGQAAQSTAERLVTTARTRYVDADNSATYRPAGIPVQPARQPRQTQPQEPPAAPAPLQKKQSAPPRVFENKKQAKRRPARQQTVTRVEKRSGAYREDDEE
ncbi:MAG TPA: hypothetical protein P5075_09780 [Eubacteriales bacterium]|nr:hypothetical protein [Eubacteriales bacterium]